MHIGIIGGTGPAGSALGARLASVGYQVVIGSRSRERGEEVVAELLGQWPDRSLPVTGDANEAAAACELVVVATPWDSAAPTAAALADALAGKVVVSMANALTKVGPDFYPLIPPRGSIAVQIQGVLARSKVVAAYQHLPAKELGLLDHPMDCDVLVCSDHRDATETVSEITAKIPGCRPLDAGSLSSAAAIEAMTATLLQLNVRYKTRVAPRFTGIGEG